MLASTLDTAGQLIPALSVVDSERLRPPRGSTLAVSTPTRANEEAFVNYQSVPKPSPAASTQCKQAGRRSLRSTAEGKGKLGSSLEEQEQPLVLAQK
jgi:hypothetical protein